MLFHELGMPVSFFSMHLFEAGLCYSSSTRLVYQYNEREFSEKVNKKVSVAS